MSSRLSIYDFLLLDPATGTERGFLVDWMTKTEQPWLLQLKEQESKAVSGVSDQEDPNFGFRDLEDTWRISFTNFSGGAGQARRDSSSSVASRYDKGYCVDTSVEGDLKLQRLRRLIGPTGMGNKTCEHGGLVWYSTANATLGWLNPQSGATGTVTVSESGPALAMASDGQYLWVSYASGLYRMEGTTATLHSSHWSCQGITDIAFAGGFLYGVRGTNIGYLNDLAIPQLVDLGQAAMIKPNLVTFGCEAVGNWVYWGVSSPGGARSWIYAVQYDPSGTSGALMKKFELYVELPVGFIGTSLAGYLSSLYVCGYHASPHSGYAQGVVYLATEQGLAHLCNVGPDPADTTAPDASYNNQIIGALGHKHHLWILTLGNLYLWDIKHGGLSHVMSLDSTYSNATTTFTQPSYWEDRGILDIHPVNNTYPLGIAYGDIHSVEHSTAGDSLTVSSNNTQGESGGRAWPSSTCRYMSYLRNTLLGDQAEISFTTSKLEGACLSVTLQTTHYVCVANFLAVKPHGVRVWVGRPGDVGPLVGSMVAHVVGTGRAHSWTLNLNDQTGVAQITCDGVLFGPVPALASGSSSPAIYLTFGWDGDDAAAYNDDSWTATVGKIKVLGRVLHPEERRSTTYQGNFTVLGGVPYIPTTSGMISLDASRYAASGYLRTSETASRMPTVLKHFSFLDIAHEPLLPGQSFSVDLYIDGKQVTQGGSYPMPFVGKPTNTAPLSAASRSGVTSVPIVTVKGHRVSFILSLAGDTTNTPILHGVSLRYMPSDITVYQYLVDLRDNSKDRQGNLGERRTSRDFLLAAVTGNRILWLTNDYESCYVKVSLINFVAKPPMPDDHFEPQGLALVTLKKVVES